MPGYEGGAGMTHFRGAGAGFLPLKGESSATGLAILQARGEVAEWLKAAPC